MTCLCRQPDCPHDEAPRVSCGIIVDEHGYVALRHQADAPEPPRRGENLQLAAAHRARQFAIERVLRLLAQRRTLTRERDEARDDTDRAMGMLRTAENARDEYARGHREICDINERLIVAHNAEVKRMTAALRKIHDGGGFDAVTIAGEALGLVPCAHCDEPRSDCEPQPSGELVCADCVINALERADEARHT
jgi:hypothetical protein